MPAQRIYTITGPASFFERGASARTFREFAAFDGYVRFLRSAGYIVTFSDPWNAAISRPLL